MQKLLVVLWQPLFGGHVSEGFDCSEEGGVIGKAWFPTDGCHFLFRILTEELLGIFDAIGIDEIWKSAAFMELDTIGDITLVGAKTLADVRDF